MEERIKIIMRKKFYLKICNKVLFMYYEKDIFPKSTALLDLVILITIYTNLSFKEVFT